MFLQSNVFTAERLIEGGVSLLIILNHIYIRRLSIMKKILRAGLIGIGAMGRGHLSNFVRFNEEGDLIKLGRRMRY